MNRRVRRPGERREETWRNVDVGSARALTVTSARHDRKDVQEGARAAELAPASTISPHACARPMPIKGRPRWPFRGMRAQIGADPLERARPDPAHPAQLLMVRKGTLLLARFDDPPGKGLANAGQLRQLGPDGGIHVDLKLGRAAPAAARIRPAVRRQPPCASHHRPIATSASATSPPTAA